MARRRRKNPHKRLRRTCKWCNRMHPASIHRFHGPGSYRRTHKKRTT